MKMEIVERLGEFYLGATESGPMLYKSADLTTHAMIVGMTGSGKTGLAISLIEEAAIDGIPAILIDPKGDLANLLLTFPELAAENFRPWINEDEARRKGFEPPTFAEKTAADWRAGLAKWGMDGERIRLMKNSAEFAIYTPGDAEGRAVRILRSFDAPEAGVNDAAGMRDRVTFTVSNLLGLIGRAADPVKDPAHILLSMIFETAWNAGRNLTLEDLVREVQNPPFKQIGVFEVETFYPSKERLALAMELNSILASPSFAVWREGEALDIRRLFYTPEGKPRVVIMSIAHLADSERMFFVTTLLNEVLAWSRRQPGTSSLRAILYMDEIFGYFPPSSNPPSKAPMLTLLKQARASGLGIVLSTQNPVDLDYKGLSNCGTWFIGRLQTERDKARIIEGLRSIGGSATSLAEISAQLSSLGSRRFLLRNVHEDAAEIFETRWAMSYLCGPLTLPQIHALMPRTFSPEVSEPPTFSASLAPASAPPIAREPPTLSVCAKIHFVNAKTKTDVWETRDLELDASEFALNTTRANLEKQIVSHIYQSETKKFFSCAAPKAISLEGESEGDFRVRLVQKLREARDAALEKLKGDYAKKAQTLGDQIRRAEERISREKAQSKQQWLNTGVSVGAAIFSVLFGRRTSISSITRAGSAARSAGRIRKEKVDLENAENNLEVLQARREEMQKKFDEDLAAIYVSVDPGELTLEEIIVRPRKSDIIITSID